MPIYSVGYWLYIWPSEIYARMRVSIKRGIVICVFLASYYRRCSNVQIYLRAGPGLLHSEVVADSCIRRQVEVILLLH